jgi:exonuclease VII small subunit
MSEVNKTVQEKLAILSETVAWFQSPAFKLEDAVTKFKQAESLAEEIEKDLTKLKNEIKVVKKKFDSDN